MRTKKTLKTKIQGTEEDASLYLVSRSFLTRMAEKYDIEPSKIIVGMQYGEMVVQKYDTGANPVWQTLEIIEFPNYG